MNQDKILLNKEKLRDAFNLFDRVSEARANILQDGDGNIDLNEISFLLGGEYAGLIDQEVFREILKEADKDGDNKISYKEFMEALN